MSIGMFFYKPRPLISSITVFLSQKKILITFIGFMIARIKYAAFYWIFYLVRKMKAIDVS